MKTNHRHERPRPLLILGRVRDASELALRRILHAKERRQSLVVVDYQGNLSALLTEKNKGNLQKGPVLWCDLVNKRRPTALFRFKRSAGMKTALRTFIENCVRLAAASVSGPTIDAVVDLAYRLADQGTIGLAALVRSLQRPETSHTLRCQKNLVTELDSLIDVLKWLLRFPAVWALSEGNNCIDLNQTLSLGGTIWIELSSSHFERLEHQVVSWMVDAVLLDALLSRADDKPSEDTLRHPPIILYGFPTSCPLPLAASVVAAKQVGLFAFSAAHSLPASAQQWLEGHADCWITGNIGDLTEGASTAWLNEAERHRLRDLQSGQVWVRSGVSRKAVIALIRPSEVSDPLAHGFRRQGLKQLRLSTVKQFSSALPGNDVPTPQNVDLYRKLSTKEALYAGWFRVKAHNRQSYGYDQITIEQFGARVDIELQKLVDELKDGSYRCGALRTARIPKPDGDVRILKIACVRDRVVQAACLQLIEPLFDARFSTASFAYRPGRGAHHAVALARSAICAGKQWAVIADIRKCFDSIDHEVLLRLIGDVIGDHDLIALIRHWLTADVIDFMDIIPTELGIAQGEAISPLLANIYLDPMDKAFEQAGITFVRYADDYVVLCGTEAEAQAALRMMGEFLQGILRLTLKPAKTHYCRVEQGVGFLGFQIEVADVRIPQEKLSATLQAVSKIVEKMTAQGTPPAEKFQALMRMNARVRGFRNYFLIDNAPSVRLQLRELDAVVDSVAGQGAAVCNEIGTAWELREKFLPDVDLDARQAQTNAEVAVLTGAYAMDAGPRVANAFLKEVTTQAPEQAHNESLVATVLSSSGSGNMVATDAPDVLIIDGRLHVMTSGCFVTVNADDLVVRRRKLEIFRTAISELKMVYLEGKGIGFSADLTMRLCDMGIQVVFTPLIGIPAAIAQPVQSTRSNVRQLQVLRREDPDIIKIGLSMLSAKVANQASVLKYFARYRKRTGDSAYGKLAESANEIRVISETLDGLDSSALAARASAMGYEGRAAAKYWASFAMLVPGELSFPGRHTRHATDPVNSAINYIYGMLYGEVWRAVIRAGLDPYFGIIHGTERDQGSLIFDMIEEYRAPFGDRLVIGMLGRGFALELDKDGRLRATTRHKLVHTFHKQWQRQIRWLGKMYTLSEILEQQVTSLKNAYLGIDQYRPFRFRW
ncbi:MAG: CRISPR-associated endonuclease Cas1 [Burkholderiales bacterium]|nr:CRISPR-associated endonuclease Cas1 [Burkholderiales bacterium]